MSQHPQQPYPQQGPPMGGPPMGGPPAYGPPPKKKGVVLLILGLLALVVGGILTIIGIGGIGAVANSAQNLAQGTGVFVAPGETTLTLASGDHFIMSFDAMEYNDRMYEPGDVFPNNTTVITVKSADGTELAVTSPQGQANFQGGSSSGEVVRQFTVANAGSYTIAVSNSAGMDERVLGVFSLDQIMQIAGGALAGIGGLACGAPLAGIGVILLIIWVIVRK